MQTLASGMTHAAQLENITLTGAAVDVSVAPVVEVCTARALPTHHVPEERWIWAKHGMSHIVAGIVARISKVSMLPSS